MQIHHIDGDPNNHEESNLVVLCFDCHRETQIVGTFDRKLDAEQVRLYRDHWIEHVRKRRLADTPAHQDELILNDTRTRIIAARLEIAKAKSDWLAVALIYDLLGDDELRDKYVDKLLAQPHAAWEEFLVRERQGRLDLVPPPIVDDTLQTDDWTVKASYLHSLGRTAESALAYIDGIRNAISNGEWFVAAYYIKYSLHGEIMNALFERALADSISDRDFWWQLRAYDELGWQSEKQELLRGHESEILNSDDLALIRELAIVKRDDELLLAIEKRLAEAGPIGWARKPK